MLIDTRCGDFGETFHITNDFIIYRKGGCNLNRGNKIRYFQCFPGYNSNSSLSLCSKLIKFQLQKVLIKRYEVDFNEIVFTVKPPVKSSVPVRHWSFDNLDGLVLMEGTGQVDFNALTTGKVVNLYIFQEYPGLNFDVLDPIYSQFS